VTGEDGAVWSAEGAGQERPAAVLAEGDQGVFGFADDVVLGGGEELEVAGMVIVSVAVAVMDVLGGSEATAEEGLHD
jgi:hypothetical protein